VQLLPLIVAAGRLIALRVTRSGPIEQLAPPTIEYERSTSTSGSHELANERVMLAAPLKNSTLQSLQLPSARRCRRRTETEFVSDQSTALEEIVYSWRSKKQSRSHVPASEQTSPPLQPPHDPPQPSLPHSRPPHDGTQLDVHAPAAEQLSPAPQLPHDPPHPSLPHSRPAHEGAQPATHTPAALQLSPAPHAPHDPPQPSSPHARPLHEHAAVDRGPQSAQSLPNAHALVTEPSPPSSHSPSLA
jgi:hypothetical protein